MQVGGVGSGHDTYSHQVTVCIHEHGENKDVGGAGTKLGSVQTIQTAEEVLQENSSVNLMSWVQNISSKGKQLLQKIWGESKEANDAITSQNGSESIGHSYLIAYGLERSVARVVPRRCLIARDE